MRRLKRCRKERCTTKRNSLYNDIHISNKPVLDCPVVPGVGEQVDVQGSCDRPGAVSATTQTCNASPVNTTDAATNVSLPTFSAAKFKNGPAGLHCFTCLVNYQTFMWVLCTPNQAASLTCTALRVTAFPYRTGLFLC